MPAMILPVVVTVTGTQIIGTASIGLRVNVIDPAILSGAASVCIGVGQAAIWRPVVTMEGADITAQVVGEITVDANEGAARLAEFVLRPPSATVLDVSGWTGNTVTIDVADYRTGSPVNPMRLFTGVVDTPTLVMVDRTVHLRCTDDLQGRCEGMSNSALYALIGGYESPAVFDPAASGWQYAQDRLSTVTSSLDISPEGAMRVTSWIPKVTPDMSFGASLLGNQSMVPAIAQRSSLTNEVLVSFDYRFPRLKSEGYPVDFEYVNLSNFAAFLLAGNGFMQRQQAVAAIRAAGGTVESITYVPLPNYVIPVGSGYFTPSAADADLCMGFTALVSFNYAQTITEQHRIAVRNQKSIDLIGLRQTRLHGALEGVYPDLTAVEDAIGRFKEHSSGIPPKDVAPVNLEKTTSINATLTTETDRAAADDAMESMIAIAKTQIWASHRQNRVSATVPLIPAIDVDKTLAINADGVDARGKCVHVRHVMDSSTAAAVSEFEIALCSVAGYGITHADDPTVAPSGTSPGQTNLPYTVSAAFHSGDAEDHEFVITFPAVADIERAHATPIISTTVAAPLVEDLFTVTI